MAVSRLHSPKVEEKYESSRIAMWKENRPATAVSDVRVWSGAGFYEATAAQHESRKQPVALPKGKAELFAALRSETPDVFKFCTWGDPGDDRPATADGDRTRAMKRYEDDTKRERTERIARRKEAGLPPLS